MKIRHLSKFSSCEGISQCYTNVILTCHYTAVELIEDQYKYLRMFTWDNSIYNIHISNTIKWDQKNQHLDFKYMYIVFYLCLNTDVVI